ncbi:MAG TPA: DUF167 domain-containing protein [bacterium]|nr:DUF167 domain-containing protein [bacterium]
MRLTVHVIPKARHPRVEPRDDGTLMVAVTAPPHEGRANAALVLALADHFGVPRSRIRIVHGHGGRRKIVEIVGTDS